MLHFLHKLSAVLFTLLGLALFGVEVLWKQAVWMPWSQVLLTTIPLPLAAWSALSVMGGVGAMAGFRKLRRRLK